MKEITNPTFKFYMRKGILPISRMMPRMVCFHGCITDFTAFKISRSLRVLYSVDGRLQSGKHLPSMAFDRYGLHLEPCII